MPETRQILHQALETVRVIDPHCHLRPAKPSADSLADIVLYHHVWIELVSSGMKQHAVTQAGLPHELADPGMPPWERVRHALPHLPDIRNTISGLFLRWILRDLYGLPDLNEHNLEAAFDVVQERAGDPGWQEEVLRQRCHIEASITVEPDGTPSSPPMLQGREGAPTNIVDGKRTAQQVLSEMGRSLGREIRTPADYRDLLAAFVRGLPVAQLQFAALWTLPSLAAPPVREEDVMLIIGKGRTGQPLTADEVGAFSTFGVCCLLDELRATDLRTIQWMAGAEVLPPHRSIPHWSSGFTSAVGRIAGAYPDFGFNLITASDAYTQDLAILAKHIPNVSVAGYWWHALYPQYILKSLETRLDIVPIGKIVGYFSDAYHSEWCYPKLKMVKLLLEDLLVERVDRGWYDLDLAIEVIDRLFYLNPKAIYKL